MYCMAAGRSCNGNSRWLRRPERNLRVWAPNLGRQDFPHAATKPDYAISDMTPQPTSSTQEVLAGLVERVTYHNAENGFCVLRAKARGHRDVVTVVGHAATIAAGEWITASGEWVNDRTHGQQFKARFLRTSPGRSAWRAELCWQQIFCRIRSHSTG